MKTNDDISIEEITIKNQLKRLNKQKNIGIATITGAIISLFVSFGFGAGLKILF